MNVIKTIQNRFKKLFSRKKDLEDTVVESSDRLELATDSISDDYVIIEHSDFAAENARYQEAAAMEKIAKGEVYKLSIPREEKPDAAHAARFRLAEQGYTLTHLGNDAAREKGLFLYALVKEAHVGDPIVIACRGTDFDASMILDLDPEGPGASAMKDMKSELMAQVEALAAKYPGRKFRISGHSLGGALAQILATNILEAVAQEKAVLSDTPVVEVESAIKEDANECAELAVAAAVPASALASIPGVDLVTFQEAWVSDATCTAAKEFATAVKNADPNFEISVLAHVKQGDFVSRMGDHVLSDIDPSVASVQLDMRANDKPILNMGDVLGIGMVAVGTANPVAVAGTTISKVLSRYWKNRIQAHKDKFHHEQDDRTNTKMTGPTYAVLSNQNPWERDRIVHVLKKNDLKHVPAHKEVSTTIHGCVNTLNSQEVCGTAQTVADVAAVVATGACLFTAPSFGSAMRFASSTGAAVSNTSENKRSLCSAGRKLLNVFRRTPRPAE